MASVKRSVYIETSILSFLCAEPSMVLMTAARQVATHEWWDLYRPLYRAYTSNEVIIEASRGDPTHARRRLDRAAELPVIERVAQDVQLARAFVREGLIPSVAEVDATHVAIAVRTKMHYLLTWNLKHLANPDVLPLVYDYLKRCGWHVPVITTPSDLMEAHR
jgi:hypothetical protein